MQWLRNWVSRLGATRLNIVGGALLTVASLIPATGLRVGLVVLGIVGLGIGIWATVIDGDEIDEYKRTVTHSLSPMQRAVVHVAETKGRKLRREAASGALASALAALLALTNGSSSRATLFYRDGDRFRPHPQLSEGRGDEPRSVFMKGTREGDDVWQMADGDEVRFYPDLSKEQPPGWDNSRSRAYGTFITVPIQYGQQPTGLLTLNDGTAGALSEDDVAIARYVAEVLGVVFCLTENHWPAVRPTDGAGGNA